MKTFRRRAWRPHEIQLLKDWFPVVGAKGCMPILPGRGLNAIKSKAGDLGLVWRESASWKQAQRWAA